MKSRARRRSTHALLLWPLRDSVEFRDPMDSDKDFLVSCMTREALLRDDGVAWAGVGGGGGLELAGSVDPVFFPLLKKEGILLRFLGPDVSSGGMTRLSYGG